MPAISSTRPDASAVGFPAASRRHALLGGAGVLAVLAIAVPAVAKAAGAGYADTRFVESGGRKLAYRSVGKGKPIVLAHRFRGVLDLWDPAFIDALAAQGFQVITFDHSGMGLSTGERSYNPSALVKDAKDLIDGLRLKDVVIGGWSFGGIVAQIYVAMFGASVSHAVLISTTPPGKLVKAGEQLFYDLAAQGPATLEQYTTMFFEPSDPASRAASQRSFERIFARETGRSPDVSVDWALAMFAAALAGMGITGLPSFVVADALRGNALERVRPGWHMLTTTLYAAMPTRKYVPARTRAFMDYLVESFDGRGGTVDPWLRGALAD